MWMTMNSHKFRGVTDQCDNGNVRVGGIQVVIAREGVLLREVKAWVCQVFTANVSQNYFGLLHLRMYNANGWGLMLTWPMLLSDNMYAY